MPVSAACDRGFTLIEVMIALLIMAVGLLGLLQSVNVAYQHNSRNKLRNESILVAQEQMNRLRQKPFDAISSTSVRTLTRCVAGGTCSFTVTLNAVALESGSAFATADAKRLEVKVAWTTRGERYEHDLYSVVGR